jgi:hypothetical protein
MTDSYWSGLGVTAGTALSTGNINTTGNSDAAAHSHTVVYNVSGTPTATYARPTTPGPGISVDSAVAAAIARLDLTQIAARGGACQVTYTPSAAPTTADATIIQGRNNAATVSNVINVVHSFTGNTIQFRTAGGTTPVTGGTTPAITASHVLQIDVVVDFNSGTPSTANGRIIGRVKNLSLSTWNTTGEFFVDTGYTVDISTGPQILTWRVGKVNNPSLQAQTYYTGIRWGERTAINTGTDATIARSNFINEVNPTAVPAGWKEARMFEPV